MEAKILVYCGSEQLQCYYAKDVNRKFLLRKVYAFVHNMMFCCFNVTEIHVYVEGHIEYVLDRS